MTPIFRRRANRVKLIAEISFELGKGRRRLEQAMEFMKPGSPYTGIDIPESPLGNPSINSVVVGSILKSSFPESIVFSHLRLIDVSRVMFLSLLSAASELSGIDALFLTMGEGKERRIASKISTEEAYKIAEEHGLEERLGAIISLRYSLSEIEKRLGSGFKKFLVLRLSQGNMDKFAEVSRLAMRRKVELYPYIIVKTEKNEKVLEQLGQPSLSPSELPDMLKAIEKRADGAVISTAGDLKSLRAIWQSF